MSATETPPGGGERHPAGVAQEENTLRPHGGTFLKDETETQEKGPNPKAQYLCLIWMTAVPNRHEFQHRPFLSCPVLLDINDSQRRAGGWMPRTPAPKRAPHPSAHCSLVPCADTVPGGPLPAPYCYCSVSRVSFSF